MSKDLKTKYTLHLTVRNKSGTLVRCAQIYSRRGHNIESLYVATKNDQQDLAIMSITAFGDRDSYRQVVAQLNRSIDVLEVKQGEE